MKFDITFTLQTDRKRYLCRTMIIAPDLDKAMEEAYELMDEYRTKLVSITQRLTE